MSNPTLTACCCPNCGTALSPDHGSIVCETCFQELANEATQALQEFDNQLELPGRREEISDDVVGSDVR